MSTEYFRKDFANQFRQEYELYTPVEEYRQGNLLFRELSHSNGIEALAISVTKKLYHAPLISRLIDKLRNEDIRQVGNLCAVVTNLRNEFHTYIQNEPYTSTYYKDLIATFDSFHELINTLKKDMYEQTLDSLMKTYTGIHEQHSRFDIDITYAYTRTEEIGEYLKNMLVYYNHFVISWQNEAGNKKGINFTTQVADYLSELICVIEQVISNMEDTLDLFLTWEVQVDLMEDQALFN